MVLAVNAGHKMNKKGVVFWMFLTIIGGFTFLGSQAWEWNHFIHGEHGALELVDGEVVHFVDKKGHFVPVAEITNQHTDHGHQPKLKTEEGILEYQLKLLSHFWENKKKFMNPIFSSSST